MLVFSRNAIFRFNTDVAVFSFAVILTMLEVAADVLTLVLGIQIVSTIIAIVYLLSHVALSFGFSHAGFMYLRTLKHAGTVNQPAGMAGVMIVAAHRRAVQAILVIGVGNACVATRWVLSYRSIVALHRR